MSRVRFRFVFNRGSRKGGFAAGGTKGIDNISRVIVRDVAFTYSENLFGLLKRDIEARMRADIQRELERMAQMFMAGVVGIEQRNRGPIGQLRSVAPRAEGFDLSLDLPVRALVPDWARRSPEYLKQRGDPAPWFHRNGSLAKMRSASAWTGAFGGISVSVFKHTDMALEGTTVPSGMLRGGYGGADRIGIATVRVEAMGHITPEMLPVLGGGALGNYGANPRRSGLLSKLGAPTAWRLGGNPDRVPFRPTIQPFLGFFLTRQVPNAVIKRLEQGLQPARWQRGDVGSGGRTR